MLVRVPELIVALSNAVKTDSSLEVQTQLLAALPTSQSEDLSFTNVETLLGSDYTAAGAWIYRNDWTTLPGYVQAWLEGSVD